MTRVRLHCTVLGATVGAPLMVEVAMRFVLPALLILTVSCVPGGVGIGPDDGLGADGYDAPCEVAPLPNDCDTAKPHGVVVDGEGAVVHLSRKAGGAVLTSCGGDDASIEAGTYCVEGDHIVCVADSGGILGPSVPECGVDADERDAGNAPPTNPFGELLPPLVRGAVSDCERQDPDPVNSHAFMWTNQSRTVVVWCNIAGGGPAVAIDYVNRRGEPDCRWFGQDIGMPYCEGAGPVWETMAGSVH